MYLIDKTDGIPSAYLLHTFRRWETFRAGHEAVLYMVGVAMSATKPRLGVWDDLVWC
jgi:hypothetical protein